MRQIPDALGAAAFDTPSSKPARPERICRDHVNLIATSRKLLGKVLNLHRGPIDRWEVGLCEQR
jgi:hypothetical protein